MSRKWIIFCAIFSLPHHIINLHIDVPNDGCGWATETVTISELHISHKKYKLMVYTLYNAHTESTSILTYLSISELNNPSRDFF